MNNYAVAKKRAAQAFLSYSQEQMAERFHLRRDAAFLYLRFLGREYRIDRKTGALTWSEDGFATAEEAGFSEAMSIYDMLCDAKPGARLSGRWCPVGSLPGVLHRTDSGLAMDGGGAATEFAQNESRFRRVCADLGGVPVALGDVGFQIPVFDFFPVILKLYRSDEDFPAQLVLLWDENTLDFIRFETAYYIAGHLFSRLRELTRLPESRLPRDESEAIW